MVSGELHDWCLLFGVDSLSCYKVLEKTITFTISRYLFFDISEYLLASFLSTKFIWLDVQCSNDRVICRSIKKISVKCHRNIHQQRTHVMFKDWRKLCSRRFGSTDTKIFTSYSSTDTTTLPITLLVSLFIFYIKYSLNTVNKITKITSLKYNPVKRTLDWAFKSGSKQTFLYLFQCENCSLRKQHGG